MAVHDHRLRVVGELPAPTAAMLRDAGYRFAPDAGLIWAAPGAAPELPDGACESASLVVLQPPIRAKDYAQVLRAARASGVPVRIADPGRRLAAVGHFVLAAGALRGLGPVAAVEASADADQIYGLLHMINDALGRIRLGERDPSSGTCSGTIGPARLRIRVEQRQVLRITLLCAAGELILPGPHGPALWQPLQGAAEPVTPVAAPTDPAEDLREAVRAELRAPESTAAALGRAQKEMSLCRLADQLTGCRHDAEAPSAPRPSGSPRLVHAADLFAGPCEKVLPAPFAELARQTADAAGSAAVDPQQVDGLAQATAVTDAFSRAAMYEAVLPALPAASLPEAVAALDTSPRHAWLVRRWLAALVDSGVLRTDEGGSLSVSAEPAAVSGRALAEAYARLGFDPLMARLHGDIAARLGQLIRDRTTIEEILFAGRDIVPALAAYQDNVASRYLNAALADAVSRVASAGPLGRRLRVVELGAGAGVCTAAVLDALRETEADYLVTDISPTLLSAAEERFGAAVRLGLLNIDADLIDQGCGLRPGAADAVVAANVLHNAADIGRSLRRIRRVLRPGGVLAVVESTRDSHAVLTSMAFLLSPPEGARATDEVFLDRQSWRHEMAGAGFAVAFDLPGQHSPLALSGQHLVLGVAL